MGTALKIRDDIAPSELRHQARRERDGMAAARMHAIAHALEGYSRAEAARLAGMERQALRDAVLAFNDRGVAGLYDRPRGRSRCRLSEAEQASLKAIILQGPDPEKDGVSTYRLKDICQIVEERFGYRYGEPGMSRLLRRQNLSRQKTRPQHPEHEPGEKERFQKNSYRRRSRPSKTLTPVSG